MKQRRFRVGFVLIPIFLLMIASAGSYAAAQSGPSEADAPALAQSVQELRQQVQELRAAVAEIKSEASQYRAESEQLRKQVEAMRGAAPLETPAPEQTASSARTADQRLSSVEETTQLLQSELKSQYQTKVERSYGTDEQEFYPLLTYKDD